MRYKGFNIYSVNGGDWRVQTGYDVIGTYKSISGAKRAITAFIKRQTIQRFGYKNTTSHAGKGQTHVIDVDQIQVIKCWFNTYGNPSYVFHMENDDMYYLVDDFGAMNGLNNHSRIIVNRKKDMFQNAISKRFSGTIASDRVHIAIRVLITPQETKMLRMC